MYMWQGWMNHQSRVERKNVLFTIRRAVKDSDFCHVSPTFSWLNLSRSLSQLKEESRRRCSARKSEPERDDEGSWADTFL